MLIKLLDIEKDLREAELCLRMGFRRMSNSHDELWFDMMEGMGFLIDDRFIPIIDMFKKCEGMTIVGRTFSLESVSSDLSAIYLMSQ